MMPKSSLSLFCVAFLTPLLLAGCRPNAETIPAAEIPTTAAAAVIDPFGDYWYQGEAELTSYTLRQSRYGELHDGEAVLIFVTEDISKKKQVKLNNPSRAGRDKVNVLKLNFSKTFTTGLYPYSMMSSIFTPIQQGEHPHTLKVTTSSQDWCGHSFTQINWREGKYYVDIHSYFEGESDENLRLDDVMLEDEIWNQIRLNPAALPTGRIELIQGTMHQRLSHTPMAVHRAEARLEEVPDTPSQQAYVVEYGQLGRTLRIHFNRELPYEIESWEEVDKDGLVTTAERLKRIKLDYWNRHSVADSTWRGELGL